MEEVGIRCKSQAASGNPAYCYSMQLADRHHPAHSGASNGAFRSLSEHNQATYQRLKLSLSLPLRRQVFLAICDDLTLRNRLAAKLYAELAYRTQRSGVLFHSSHYAAAARDGLIGTPSVEHSSTLEYPRLVSLTLNLSNPNLPAQITRWLRRYPPPKDSSQRDCPPSFQILGAEHLTRQPGFVQQQFLFYLQEIGRSLNSLDGTLLLWLTRPWFYAMQQSAPAFWDCHTALFEFEGDPTPVPAVRSRPMAPEPMSPPVPTRWKQPIDPVIRTNGAATAGHDVELQPILEAETLADPSAASALENSLTLEAQPNGQVDHLLSAPAPNQPPPADAVAVAPTVEAEPARTHASSTQDETAWDLVTYDLALFEEESSEHLPASELPLAEPVETVANSSLAEVDEALPVVTVTPGDDRTASELPPNPVTEGLPEQEVNRETSAVGGSSLQEPTTVSPDPDESNPADRSIQPALISHAYPDLAELIKAAPVVPEGILVAQQQLEQLQQQHVTGNALAATYQTIGNLYRERIEQGDNVTPVLLIAIHAYEQMLAHLQDANSLLWSDAPNDVGNLYWMLARQTPDMEQSLSYLEQGIAAYQFALNQTDPQSRPHSYAMIQNNLGSAYGDLARYRDPAETLQQSVAAYEEALRYRKPEEDPARYAATQNNLGTAYWNLAQHHQPVSRLQQAIAAYQEALRYYSQEREPLHYAMIQNNLGTAYWNLAQFDPAVTGKRSADAPETSAAELLTWAVQAYEIALVHRTLEVSPAAHAATQNNLGTAYWHLANLTATPATQRQGLLRSAIEAYQAALAAVQYLQAAAGQAPALTFDPFATQNNLGLAYYQLATDKQAQHATVDRSCYLEAALQHHLQALQGWEKHPDFYQTALNYVVQTVRGFYSECGMNGQNLALSKIPASLLSEVMKRI